MSASRHPGRLPYGTIPSYAEIDTLGIYSDASAGGRKTSKHYEEIEHDERLVCAIACKANTNSMEQGQK